MQRACAIRLSQVNMVNKFQFNVLLLASVSSVRMIRDWSSCISYTTVMKMSYYIFLRMAGMAGNSNVFVML